MVSFQAVHVERLNPNLSEQEEPDYVFDIKPCAQDDHSLLVSASDMKVRVYDVNNFQQKVIINAHRDRINATSYSPQCPQRFYTGAADCTVKGWDARDAACVETSQSTFSFKMEDEVQALACNVHDNLLAVGVGMDIHFFDLRKTSSNSGTAMKSCLLGTYSDVHSDMVTQLEFSLHQPSLLMSGAEDGLMVMYDTATAEAEEAVLSILNTDCPVRKCGFFGPNMEDIRDTLGADYLVDCCFEHGSSKLQLVTGMYDGSASFADIDPAGYKHSGVSLLQQHSSTVRCCVPLPYVTPLRSESRAAQIHSYVTGGEDGKLVYWKRQGFDEQVDIEEVMEKEEREAVHDEGDKFDLVARTELQEQADALAEEEDKMDQRNDNTNTTASGHSKNIRLKKRSGNFRIRLRHNPY